MCWTSQSTGEVSGSRPRAVAQEPGERTAGEGIPRAQVDPLGDRRGEVAEADRLVDDPGGRRPIGRGDDQQGDVDFPAVEAQAVAEEAVLAEVLAVVGGHDHQGVLQQPAALELVEEAAELPVEVGDATLVGVAEQVDRLVADPARGCRRRGGLSRRQVAGTA